MIQKRIYGLLVASIVLVFVVVFLLRVPIATAEDPTPTPSPTPTSSSNDDVKKKELKDKISELEGKVTELQAQKKTLNSQIGIIDNQVRLSELKIQDTEERIDDIQKDVDITKGKINNLEGDLDRNTKALVGRVSKVYKEGTTDPWQILLTSDSLDNFFTRLKYLKIVQLFDKKNVYAAEQSKVSYENQQEILLEKQQEEEALNKQLEGFTKKLNEDKAAKKVILAETQGSEANYQKLLSQVRAEYNAIQGIVAGNGSEVEVGKVSEGDRIASIIAGPSCNSSGAHLHFIVRSGSSTVDPFSYLKGIDHENCSGSSCGSGDGDSFSPSGSWSWPIDAKITMNQGYGETWAVRNTWAGQVYRFHNGIDVLGSGYTVKAVKSGTLYHGSYAGGGGCRLPYVRVKHDEGGLDTLYLHVNY